MKTTNSQDFKTSVLEQLPGFIPNGNGGYIATFGDREIQFYMRKRQRCKQYNFEVQHGPTTHFFTCDRPADAVNRIAQITSHEKNHQKTGLPGYLP